jgi:2-octaprenyl-6-methoxyphenol hydroxylase
MSDTNGADRITSVRIGEATRAVDIGIIGAGPVGGALACRLAAAGISVAIVDRAALPPMEHPDFDGRAYAIAAGSRAMLEAAELWDRLPYPAGPIRDIRVSDGKVGRPASPLRLHFAAGAAGADAFGWMVEARGLRMALNARMHELDNLSVHAPATATVTRSADGAEIRVTGGPSIACRLVVAAEGRRSPLREAAGIPVTRLDYDQTGIVFAIAHERPHNGVALEHFLPGGPFAQLPMAGNEDEPNLSAIVWTERGGLAAYLLEMPPERFAHEVARRLGDHLGKIRLVGRRWSYPLSAMHAHRYVDTRLALVGDAAHGVHPIAGQGLNLGFLDVAELSRLVIAAVSDGEDPGSPDLLRRYQAARRPANLAMLAATDTLDRLFSSDSRLLRAARDIGIAAVDRLPGLKRMFIRQAMGAA